MGVVREGVAAVRPWAMGLAIAVAAMPSLGQGFDLTDETSTSDGGGEILAFDAFNDLVFGSFNNDNAQGVDYATLDSAGQFGPISSVDFTSYFTSINFDAGDVTSVDIDPDGRGFGVAAVTEASGGQGIVVFFDTDAKQVLGDLTVGFHPDMVVIDSAGDTLMVANEGDNAASANAPGSVSQISLAGFGGGDPSGLGVTTTDFSGLGSLLEGVRDPEAAMNTATSLPDANNIEPEYIAIQGGKAYVALQENNAVAVYDLASNSFTAVQSLAPNGQVIDASDLDAGITIDDVVVGLPVPDAIDTFSVGGSTFYVTANEGDFLDSGNDEFRGDDFGVGQGTVGALDPAYDAALDALYGGDWQTHDALGRLTFYNNVGDTDGDGDIDQLRMAGTRSMSVYDDSGSLVFDTSDLTGFFGLEQWIAANDPDNWQDGRSDNKGPEPEGVVVGEIDGDLYAFLNAERTDHLFMFKLLDSGDTSFDPLDVEFIDAFFLETLESPEGFDFIDAADSPTGAALLLVGYEDSGSWAAYTVPEPASLALLAAGATLMMSRRQRAA
jgi:hypothetical protein